MPPDGTLPGAKFTLRPNLTFPCIGNVTARHSSRGRQPNFAAWYKEWNYGTFVEGATYIRLGGHDVGHRPTFYLFHNNPYCSANSTGDASKQSTVTVECICRIKRRAVTKAIDTTRSNTHNDCVNALKEPHPRQVIAVIMNTRAQQLRLRWTTV